MVGRKLRLLLALSLAVAALGCGDDSGGGGNNNQNADMPRGIPAPEFCINETVETTCADCTQLTDPPIDDLSDLDPGTVVTLTGGPYTGGTITIGGRGLSDRPIFVRGPDPSSAPVISRETHIEGRYIVVENFEFDFDGGDTGIRMVGDHICLRNNDIHHIDPGHNSTTVFMTDSEHIVIYQNAIHDNGDFTFVGEQDVHGIGASMSHNIWILNNLLHHNRGDSIQFGHQANNTVGDIYIGGNEMHSDGENCVDIKEASNVVISENDLYNAAPGMPAVVLHDCPVNAAVIFNDIHDSETGVSMASLESVCDDDQPVNLFVIRNHIHDIGGQAIQGWGSGKLYYVAGNTFANVGEPVSVDPAEPGSVISEDDTGLVLAFAEFLSTYGIDISTP